MWHSMVSGSDEIAVTGLGAISALGVGCDALLDGIETGRHGIRAIRRFSTAAFTTHLAGLVPGSNGAPTATAPASAVDLCARFASTAAREAWGQSRAAAARLAAERVALVLGTSLGTPGRGIHTLARQLAEEFDIRGPCITISTACSASTNAIGLAGDLIRLGIADLILTGGVDILTPEIFAGFHSLGVLNPRRCIPFSRSIGTTLGEGAGFLVLEKAAHARQRGANPLGAIAGYGLSADAHHETSPDPTGAGVSRALAAAIRDAGLEPAQIDYVNAHGTGTAANDAAEWAGIHRVLGTGAASIPISSVKGFLGHAQGAAGALETITVLLARQRAAIPPTLGLTQERPNSPVDPVPGTRPRPCPWEHAASLNSAFGGSNAALVLSRNGHDRRARPNRSLFILGVGAVGPHGQDLASLRNALQADSGTDGRTPDFPIGDFVPTADPRGIDPASRYLTAAAAAALSDAEITIRGSLRDGTGLIVGMTRPSPASTAAFEKSIRERGLPLLSAAAFARVVLNAPAGCCSKLLTLRGPCLTLTTGRGSGLSAILTAIGILSRRDDTEFLVAGGVDELPEGSEPPQERGRAADGAGCIVLGSRPSRSDPPAARVAGWSLAGGQQLPRAVDAALEIAQVPAECIPLVFAADTADLAALEQRQRARARLIDLSRFLGRAEAATASWSVIAAVLALRGGRAPRALVIGGTGSPTCGALLLENP